MNHPLMTVLYQRVSQRLDQILIKVDAYLTDQKELNKLRKRKIRLEIKKLEREVGPALKEEE